MSTKRSASSIHPSRQGQVPHDPRKRRKPNSYANKGKSFKKAHPVNELKSQVRSLRRLLEKNDNLPPSVRVEKERALRTAEHELEEARKATSRSNIIGRYHKIRFFDRKRATKRLNRAKKALRECEDESEREVLAERVDEADTELNYAMFYPLETPYVSLFPSTKKEGDQDDGDKEDAGQGHSKLDQERQGDPTMWEAVKECMKNGTLEALRNGQIDVRPANVKMKKGVGTKQPRPTPEKSSKTKDKIKTKAAGREEDDTLADSDDERGGGFFE